MNIRLLPSFLINQIAAGEVIERPAAVFKELLENSLDANAKNIVIVISQDLLELIIIKDDGEGIAKQDLELACMRHSTSKIRNDDIFSIATLGFRGEALASIAAVSELEIASKPTEQAMAFAIEAKYGVVSET